MSGGRRIDDHKFFAGGMSKDSVLPKGVHVQSQEDSAGSGHEAYYEDTSKAIHSAQEMNAKKAKSHEMKPNYRH